MPARPDGRATDRLVFLHGFTQTHHHWHAVAHAIAAELTPQPSLAFVDLPGHGLATQDRTAIGDAAAPLAALVGPGTYIGYSMGGRFALAAALARPDLVERLVLVGATPGIDDPVLRADRRALDEERAGQVEGEGLDAFVETWLAAPMFAGLPDDPVGLQHRRRNTTAGLATSLRTAGTGSQPPLWGKLRRFEAPVLVIAGDRDRKFTDIGQAMANALPDATFEAISDAGHAAHTERPADTAQLIGGWLVRTRDRPRSR